MSLLTPHQSTALNTKGHLALTANAGSGKTFVLARKYLNALVSEGFDISNIAAITFTEKAASELYNKISILIEEQVIICTDSKEKKILEKIRRQLVSANISTIHSFCINILKDFPVESQLDAQFTPIDENLSRELIDLSVEETLKDLFEKKDSIETIKYLIRIFGSKIKLKNQLIRLIQSRKNVEKVKVEFYCDETANIAKRFSHLFDEVFSNIWKKKSSLIIGKIKNINDAVLSTDSENQTAKEVKYLINELEKSQEVNSVLINLKKLKSFAFTSTLTIKKRGYVNKTVYNNIFSDIDIAESSVAEFSDFEYSEDVKLVETELAKFGKNILAIYDKSLNAYEIRKKNEGFIDYEDILLHTKILLENIDVQKQLAAKYKFIMVDEFQDTNEIQYQIFLPILDYLKKGKLFIVGDEKQSIYKFRDAEIEIFNLTRNDIKNSESDSNLLSLPDSFRMAPTICAVCNHVIRNLFNEPDQEFGEVPATDLVCARNDSVKGNVEFLISVKGGDNNFESESELIAKKILLLVSEKSYSFNDISILVRKRKHFVGLEKVFLNYQIPFAIIGGRGFYQRQIISDIYNYLSFLADKNNSTALVGVLRSPFFTVSDSKIFEISLLPEKSFWEKLKNFDDDKIIQSICNTLNENITLSNSIGLSQLIEKIITDNNYLPIIASRNDGEQEIANIEKLISIARNFNSTGFRNIYDFLSYLKDSIINQSDESQAGITANIDSVQMMTIHQSKGLEFPVVFLCNANESGISSTIKTGEIKVDKKFGLLAKVPINNNFFEEYHTAPIVSLHNYYESRKDNAELKRLLYVAMTRAKDELFISAEIDFERNIKKDSFLDLLHTGLNTDFKADIISFEEKLEFIKNINSVYINESKEINITVPVLNVIEFENKIEIKKEKIIPSPEINLTLVTNREKGEIISASKVSIFNQCPLKYLLTYDYGYGKLIGELNKNISERNKNPFIKENEDESEFPEDYDFIAKRIKISDKYGFDSALYGKLFHKALELQINISDIDNLIKDELYHTGRENAVANSLADRLKSELEGFYKSKIWLEISSASDYKNEFEIYVKEKDYYLHGIIDKIIFKEKQILIVDYKTDEINKNEIKKRSEFYLMQLKFYLYIASRLFTEFDSFEGKLIFIKHPDNPVTLAFDKNQIEILDKEITTIIESIRNKSSEKNIKHCSVCTFSDAAKNCVLK